MTTSNSSALVGGPTLVQRAVATIAYVAMCPLISDSLSIPASAVLIGIAWGVSNHLWVNSHLARAYDLVAILIPLVIAHYAIARWGSRDAADLTVILLYGPFTALQISLAVVGALDARWKALWRPRILKPIRGPATPSR